VVLILSASVGALGGLRGLVHLRAILQNIFMHVIPGQKSISNAMEAFDAAGNLKSNEQKEAIKDLSAKLVEVTRKLKG
jgi:NAD(P)H-dependent FMN reductase